MMEKQALYFVFLQFFIFYTSQTKGITSYDIEEKFIKTNVTAEKSGFQIYSPHHNICVAVDSSDNVTIGRCDLENVGQRWTWINHDLLLHKSTGKCLAVDGDIIDEEKLKVLPCNISSTKQRWFCAEDLLRIVGTAMNMNFGHGGEYHIILLKATGVFNQWKIYQTHSTLCSAYPGYRRFQIYSQTFGVCAGVDNSGYVYGQTCNANSPAQGWYWVNKKQIRHEGSERCLDVIGGIASGNKLLVKACDPTAKSQKWACNGLFLQVGGTDEKMNYGKAAVKPNIVLFHGNGSWNNWSIYQTPSSTLCSINPYNEFLKITTVTMKPFCSIECVKEKGCKSFIFLEYQKSDNCLLSSDPDGNHSMSYDGASFVKLPKQAVCDHNNCQRRSTCVPVPSISPYYACFCPPWASGFHCENLKTGYDHSLLSWKIGPGNGIKTVDSAYQTWITISYDVVFWLYENDPAQGKWINQHGNLKQVTVGPSGVYGVTSGDLILERIGVDSINPAGNAWLQHSNVSLSQITSGNPGVVWGINRAAKLFYRNGVKWQFFGDGYRWVSCGKFGCWVIRANGTTIFRTGVTTVNPGGVAWVETGGSFKQLDTGVRGEVYAVDEAGYMYTREGISESLPQGTKWSQFGNMLFAHVSIGDKLLCGLFKGQLYTLFV